MNEEALIDAHGLFVKNGYEGKLSDFKNLISTNKEALIDAHKLFVKEGYNGNVNDFSLLIGVKKKDNSQSSGQKTQEVSSTRTSKRTSLLDTGKPKAAAQLGSSSGDNGFESFVKEKGVKVNLSTPKSVSDKELVKQSVKAQRGTPKVAPGLEKPIQIPEPVTRTNVPSKVGLDVKKEAVKQFEREEATKAMFDRTTYSVDELETIDAYLNKGDRKSLTDEQFKRMYGFVDKNTFNSLKQQKLQEAKEISSTDFVTKSEYQEILDEYEKTIKGESILERGKAIAKSAVTTMYNVLTGGGVIKPEEVERPLQNYRDEVLKEAREQKKVLTPKEIEAKTKQKFIDDRFNEVLNSKRNNTIDKMTDGQQFALVQDKKVKREKLDDSQKQIANSIQSLSNSLRKNIDERNELIASYKDLLQTGEGVSKEDLDRYNILTENINNNIPLLKSYYKQINGNSKNIESLSKEIDNYKVEQNDWLDLSQRISNSVIGLTANTLEIIGKYGGVGIAPHNLIDIKTNPFIQGSDFLGKVKEEGAKGIRSTESIESVNDLINYTTEVVGNNAVIVAGLTMGGAPGMYALAGDMAGEKSREMRQSNEEVSKKYFEAKNSAPNENGERLFEFKGKSYDANKVSLDDLKYSETQQNVVPLLWGATGLIPLAKQLRTIQGSNRALLAAELEGFSTKKTVAKKVYDSLSGYAKHTIGLGNDLKLMSFGQGIINLGLGEETDFAEIALDLKPYREAAILHSMNMVAAQAVAKTAEPFTDSASKKLIAENASIELGLLNRLKSIDVTPEESVIIKKQIKRLHKESEMAINKTIGRMSEMSDAQYDKTIELAKKSAMIKAEAFEIQNSKALSKEQKQVALDKLKRDFTKNEIELKNNVDNFTPSENYKKPAEEIIKEAEDKFEQDKKSGKIKVEEQKPVEVVEEPTKNVEEKPVSDLETKKAEIEKRREEEIKNTDGLTVRQAKSINAKYDAEIAELEKKPSEVKPEEKTVENKNIVEDYVSLSEKIESIDKKINSAKRESRKQKLVEEKNQLLEKQNELKLKDPKLKELEDNFDNILKELKKKGLEEKPCNI